ncbi:hypothetical protein [Variovorax paradoxus]|uniref:hypothetical protein n=1 Tax=Variovorax paradoxus TaxID=34073 RepID=UPI0029C92537|nr:hypothetical protein RZE77_23885 [Variovorax paradoxus]
MKLIEGRLKRLGESTVNMKNEVVKYSLIQIGDKTLTNVMIDRKLNNFLQDGVETEKATRLWFLNGGKIVMGVQVGDDTRYYGTINPFFYFAMLFNIVFTGIVFTYQPLGALAWAVLIYAIGGRRWLDYRRVAAAGGMKV